MIKTKCMDGVSINSQAFSTFGGGADVIFNGGDGMVDAMWGNK